MKKNLDIHDSLIDYPEATLHYNGHIRLFMINNLVNDVDICDSYRGFDEPCDPELGLRGLYEPSHLKLKKKLNKSPPE